LRPDQKRRYLRHILLFGAEGQERLLAAAVAVDEAAGAGAAALWYLAAAGVGTLVVADEGAVRPEDVGLIFEIADVGRSRREAAAERLAALNPDVTVVASGAAARRIPALPARDEADALAIGAAAAGAAIWALLT
jgi:sulfur-carrier protein adenylyltransferase/sulfurtransferase